MVDKWGSWTWKVYARGFQTLCVCGPPFEIKNLSPGVQGRQVLNLWDSGSHENFEPAGLGDGVSPEEGLGDEWGRTAGLLSLLHRALVVASTAGAWGPP